MLVMTAKVDKKKIALVLAAVAAAIVGLVLLFGGRDTETAATVSVTSNDDRVKFLTEFGWEAAASPVESGLVKIPETSSAVYDRYNQLQKSQGYDLSRFAGKNVMRYVYKITNFPGATQPVYATLLIYKNQVIGGDITDTSAKGAVRGFRMPAPSGTPATELSPTSPSAGYTEP